MRVWNGSHRGSYHLFGHSHGGLPSHGLSFDVGVDCHNYSPISYDDVDKKMKKLKEDQKHMSKHDDWNHHKKNM